MHFENGRYGHRFILACYAGLRRTDAPILGFLQHGWTPNGQYHSGNPTWPMSRLFVWSRRDLSTARQSGATRVSAIGSPFLYLSEMLKWGRRAEPIGRSGNSTIVFPAHSSFDMLHTKAHREYAASLVKDCDPKATIVCLYWKDYSVAEIRSAYTRYGYHTTTMGHRDDFLVLFRQHSLLLTGARAKSNVVSSAVLYAASMGLDVHVDGPPFDMSRTGDGASIRKEQAIRWPELFSGISRRSVILALARSELGYEFMLGPSDLQHALGWSDLGSRAWANVSRPGLLLASRVRRRQGGKSAAPE